MLQCSAAKATPTCSVECWVKVDAADAKLLLPAAILLHLVAGEVLASTSTSAFLGVCAKVVAVVVIVVVVKWFPTAV